MSDRIRTFVSRHIVTEVPSELSACLDCGLEQCTTQQWKTCPARLARAAALDRLDQATAAQSCAVQGTDSRPMLPDAGHDCSKIIPRETVGQSAGG